MFLLIALVFLVSNSLKFVEAQRGESVSSLLGENVTLSCSPDPTHRFPSMLTGVDCIDTYSISWIKYGGGGLVTYGDISHCLSFSNNPFYNDDRFTADYLDNKYNLRISNVQPSDIGQYLCVTGDYTSTETALYVQIHINEPSCSANPQVIEVGDYVSLVCSLQIQRALQWIAPNGTVLASRSDESNSVKSLVFNFTAREEQSFQTFTCVAVSESGTYNPECELTPLEYTFISITPLKSHVKQGDNVMLNCDARLGVRAPNRYDYTWLQDGNIVLTGLSISSYTIYNLQLSDNVTRVQCKASNDGGEESESREATIYVDSVTEMTTRRPEEDITTLNYPEELTSAPNTTAIVGDNCDNCAYSFNTLTKSLLATCVILLVTSFSVNVALVVCLVKSRQAYSNAENSPTGGSQMTYTDLQLRDVTKAEYETCRVKSADNNAYEAVDGEYEVPPTDTVDNSVDTGLYELPKA